MTARVLIVDDSLSMQKLIAVVLESDKDIDVIGFAADPMEARIAIKELNPDVITLDIEMPGMNGIQFLEKIMTLRPMPVVMISSHTQRGADVSLEALEKGAFCCLPKPKFDDETALKEMCMMVKQAARSGDAVKRNAKISNAASKGTNVETVNNTSDDGTPPELIVVGSSTGGVEALTQLFSRFPKDCPPTVVTQHMPAAFTKSLASRLDAICKPKIVEATNGATLEKGHIYIAPGGIAHTTIAGNVSPRIRFEPGEPVNGHLPSVDMLFQSAARIRSKKISAAILTGMGNDGANGMLALNQNNAKTIAQDQQTSLVFGMPAAAIKLGAAAHVLPLENIANALIKI
ncbi:MAG: chemotaxis response regulator protein-glutamate methylesterase [Rhizobiales bacterium]|nr:chemotaxis response regulator protein-glutamate methylesterase [Hyphomicrobiales bacterium]